MTLLLDVAIASAHALETILRIEPEEVCPTLPLQYARIELPLVAREHEHLHLAARNLRERRAKALRAAGFEDDLGDGLLVREAGVRVQVQRQQEQHRCDREQHDATERAAARG